MIRLRLATLAALLALNAPAGAQNQGAPYVVAETGRSFGSLQSAVFAIGSGQGTILFAPGTVRECAVQNAGSIVYKARVPGATVFDGVTCEGKAALVLNGRYAKIDGLIFQNMKVPDANGAGVRIERGNIDVFNSTFRNSELGIMSSNVKSGETITVEHSTFTGLGGCPDEVRCTHSLYVGDYGRLIVRYSRFEQGRAGHYLKSRSAYAEVTDNSFDDSNGFNTNYMIDLPQGAVGSIVRNEFVQGGNKDNPTILIAVGAEVKLRNHSSAGLVIANNRASFTPDARKSAAFIADWTGEGLNIQGNQLDRGLRPYELRHRND